nr:MAG TPA: hypothetical protein [Bacteriophage sp.]
MSSSYKFHFGFFMSILIPNKIIILSTIILSVY